VLLQALARQAASLAPAGEPVRRLNNTLSGFASLPLTLRAPAHQAMSRNGDGYPAGTSSAVASSRARARHHCWPRAGST
jgi:hypothetical protein